MTGQPNVENMWKGSDRDAMREIGTRSEDLLSFPDV
jgi:hypothetical protein